MAPPIPADQPKGRSTAEGRQQAQQAAKPEAAEQDGEDAAKATKPQAAEPHRAPAPTADESSAAPQSTAPATPSAARPPIRKGAAYTGTVIALLAGIAGIISQVLDHTSSQSGVNYFFSLAIFSVPVVVAVIALMQIYRLVIIGFLQGMFWLAVPSLAAYIVILAHLSHITGRFRAADLLEFTGFALGVIAAILLMVSWTPAVDRLAMVSWSPDVDRRRAPLIRALPMILLGAAGLSQIASLIFLVTVAHTFVFASLLPYFQPYFYILGSAGVLVVLAVTWYAMSLRVRALGGALVLGWVTTAALLLCILMTQYWSNISGVGHFCVVLEFVLLAAIVMLTIIYVQGPSQLEGSANQ